MPPTRSRGRRDSLVFTILVTAVVALCALPIAFVIAMSSAPDTLVLATIVAALPVGPWWRATSGWTATSPSHARCSP